MHMLRTEMSILAKNAKRQLQLQQKQYELPRHRTQRRKMSERPKNCGTTKAKFDFNQLNAVKNKKKCYLRLHLYSYNTLHK